MELLEGEDLRDRLGRVGRLSDEQSVDYIMQALEAMAHAHAAGIVHRDLKPENLFVATGPDGREVIRVLDFGIAKLSPSDGTSLGGRLTAEHSVLGSPHYMAPEQVRDSGVIDPRADVWAIGAILYELVTGREAFPGESAGEVFASVLHTTPSPMYTLCPDVPPLLDAVVARCLARETDQRFANVAELAFALAAMASAERSAYAERIEHILTLPQRLSDPALGAAESGPVSVRRMRGILSSIPAAASPPSGVVRLGSAPASRPAAHSAPPLVQVPTRTARSGRWTLVLLDVAMTIATILALLRTRMQAPKGPLIVAPTYGTATPIGSSTESLRPLVPLLPTPPAIWSVPSAGPALSARASTVAGRKNKPPSVPSGSAAARPQTSASPHLPSVLGSPD
jgi:serine/threonine-protein kinase